MLLALLCLLPVQANAQAQPVSIAVGADNLTRLLWNNPDGTVGLWKIDSNGAVASQASYGPYAGWSGKSLSVGSDGIARVLWTNTNGTAALWRISPDGSFTSPNFGPYPGWTALNTAVGGDNVSRVLWGNTDGTMALWSVAADGSLVSTQFGPYAGCNDFRVAAGPNSVPRTLWNYTDGRVSLWTGTPDQSSYAYTQYGPFGGWSVSALAVDSGNAARLVWWHPSDAQASLWKVSGDGSYTTQNFTAPGGYSPVGLAAGTGGDVRLLWGNGQGGALVWTIQADGTYAQVYPAVSTGGGGGTGGGGSTTPATPNPHGYYSVLYSGGTLTSSDPNAIPSYSTGSSSTYGTGSYSGSISGSGYSGSGISVRLSGGVSATFTWHADPAYPGSPAPAQVTVIERCTSSWAINGYSDGVSGQSATGFGQQNGPSSTSGGASSGSVSGISSASGGGAQFTIQCSPTALVSGGQGSSYICSRGTVSFEYTATPVLMSLAGVTRDPSNNTDNILVGQSCTAQISNIPSSLLPNASYQWSVSGNTFQSWTTTYQPATKAVAATPTTPAVPAKDASSTATLVAGPGVLTNSTAHWFWSDKKSTPQIKCIVTITPPNGQGAAFNIVAPSQSVNLIRPTGDVKLFPGTVTLNANYYNPGTWLYLGLPNPNSNNQGHGMEWRVQVDKPLSPFPASPLGVWNFVQTDVPHRYNTPTGGTEEKSAFFGNYGLDVTYPYDPPIYGRPIQTWDADNTVHTDGDSPAIELTNDFTSFRIDPADTFNTYVMYTPPIATAPNAAVAWVPLYNITWSWSASASRSSTGSWSTVEPAGSVPTPTFKEEYTHPQWTTINAPAPPK